MVIDKEAVTTSRQEVIKHRAEVRLRNSARMRREFTKEVYSLTEFYNLIEPIWIHETYLHYFGEISSKTP